MRSFSEYLDGRAVVSEDNPVSKTVDQKHQKDIEQKLLVAGSELSELYSRWQNVRIMSFHKDYAFPVKMGMAELSEMENALRKLAHDLEVVADDISAGPESVWNRS